MPAYFGAIEEQTLENENFRQVIFTGDHLQLVVMCLRPGQEIGSEVHEHVDQFFRIEEGQARFVLNGSEVHVLHANEAAVIPAGTLHNVINASDDRALRLYTIYSPPNHPAGTVHVDKADAEAAEAHKHPQ
jgi:mannose-6-phosphate isomerase-like protein (cupin superfamily)